MGRHRLTWPDRAGLLGSVVADREYEIEFGRVGAGELGQITTFALMLGGSYTHALAPELSLRPVLVEIGASCPAPSLYLLDSDYEASEDLEKWLTVARRFVPAVSS